MFRRATVTVVLVLSSAALPARPALADSGSMADPSGDFPDIVKLSYNNAQDKVVMTMKLADLELAQGLSFYMRWKTGNYQVFYNKPVADAELRYKGDAVGCKGLAVTELPDKEAVRVRVPRGCLPKAPDGLKFQGIATAGLTNSDETDVSARVPRG